MPLEIIEDGGPGRRTLSQKSEFFSKHISLLRDVGS
jgi:hypothetical protein